MQKSHALGGAALVAAACLALFVWCCAGSDREARAPDDPSLQPGAEPGSSTNAGAVLPGAEASATPSGEKPENDPRANAVTSAALPSSSASPGSGAAERINNALDRDPRDLALFARIERELKRDPPPEVNAIVALRARGATRAELLAETNRRLPNDLLLRALVVRWIDEVAPASGASQSPAPARSGPPLVQPIRKK